MYIYIYMLYYICAILVDCSTLQVSDRYDDKWGMSDHLID